MRGGLASKIIIPRLSTGNSRRFRSWCRKTSVSSISGVFADEETSEGRCDHSVSGMKLRSKKNLDGDEGQSTAIGAVNMSPNDHFVEGEQTVNRCYRYQHDAPEGPATSLSGTEIKNLSRHRSVPRLKEERNYCQSDV